MIEIRNISFKYMDKLVLRNISMSIRESGFIAILGANGSGKTTLIKHLNSLLIPSEGDILVDNLNTKSNSWDIKQKVGMVFQNPDDQIVSSVVEEDVAFGLENLGLPSNEIQKRVAEILRKLNISHISKENVNNLSFGQKQLVALAGILVMKPKYIVFDEPTTMLDPKNKSNIMNVMDLLNQEGSAIILVTNNLNDIKKYVKDIAVIRDGRVIFNDKKERLTKSILKKADMYGE